jgi:hypothetical protein
MKYATAQIVEFYVWDSNDAAVEDQQANITCELSKDGGTAAELTNEDITGYTQIGDGRYSIYVTVAESTCHQMSFRPACPGYQIMALPSNVIYTDISHLIQASTDLIPDLADLRTSRQTGQDLYVNTGETHNLPILVGKDYTSTAIEVVISSRNGAELAVLTPTAITPLQVNVDIPSNVSRSPRVLQWAVRETANGDKSNDNGTLFVERIATNI